MAQTEANNQKEAITVQTHDGLQIVDCLLPGYHPAVDFGAWRTALTNGGPRQSLEAIDSLSRHRETDEIFVLLKGSCTLFTAGNDEDFHDILATPMEIGRVYNVTKGTWHGRALSSDGVVFIVENRDTTAENSDSRPLNEEQLSSLRKKAAACR